MWWILLFIKISDMQKALKIEIRNDDAKSVVVVHFDGDLDTVGYSDVKDEINEFIKTFKKDFLVFDFHKLKFINSEGIGYLMEIHAHLVKTNQKLVLIGPNAHVQDVFSAIGITTIIPVYGGISEFLNTL